MNHEILIISNLILILLTNIVSLIYCGLIHTRNIRIYEIENKRLREINSELKSEIMILRKDLNQACKGISETAFVFTLDGIKVLPKNWNEKVWN